ncbi:MAG: PepSY-like domain-containing protein [Ignavibacteria bacterium]
MKHIQLAKKLTITVFVLFSFTILVNDINAQENENSKKYSEKDIPNSVMESFKRDYPNATVIGYDKGNENGIQIYEIETKEGNLYRDLEYTSDGKIFETGEIIDINSLPVIVSNSISKNFSQAKIIEAEKKTGSTAVTYEVIIESGNKKYEVLLSQDGNILKKSDEDTDKNGDDSETDDD